MTDYGRSLIRTFVPLLVGSLVAWLATRGVKVDSSTLLPLVDAFATGLYYGVVRWLETRWPKLGWLLGVPGAPQYAAPATNPSTGVTVSSSSSIDSPPSYIAQGEVLNGIPDPNVKGTLQGLAVDLPGEPAGTSNAVSQ